MKKRYCLFLMYFIVGKVCLSSMPDIEIFDQKYKPLTTAQDLPKDMLTEIFSRLETRDLSSASKVCKNWHAHAQPILTIKHQQQQNQKRQRDDFWIKHLKKNPPRPTQTWPDLDKQLARRSLEEQSRIMLLPYSSH